MSTATSAQSARSHDIAGACAPTSRRRRVAEVVVFVAVWMTAGFVLHLPSNGYLLLGIPLTAAFQVLVRRRPLRELFATGTARFPITPQGAVMALILASAPAV